MADYDNPLASVDHEEIIRRDDLKWVMGDKRGRRFVARLLEQAGIYTVVTELDPRAAALREGHRNAGLQVLAEVNRDAPELYLTLLQERMNDARRKPA